MLAFSIKLVMFTVGLHTAMYGYANHLPTQTLVGSFLVGLWYGVMFPTSKDEQ